jgi:RNA polymerase sigma-70 factor, ECF subfamily
LPPHQLFHLLCVFLPYEESALVRQAFAFEVFVACYQEGRDPVALRMLAFDPTYRFFTWMYRIVVNDCLEGTGVPGAEEPLVARATTGGTRSDTAVPEAQRAQVEAALQQLTPEYRAIVVLHQFVGQSYCEIAETMAISERTVRFRLNAARQRLGEQLVPWRDED